MFERNETTEDRGQVGIGTLIVFIALVLVAAIAAGVLVNTAGFLQTQAEQTGEQSSQQVSDRLEPVSVTGDVNSNAISDTDFMFQKAPGASDINVSRATMTITGPDGTERLALTNSSVFSFETYQDEDNSLTTGSYVLNSRADRLVVTLDWSASDHGELNAGDEVQIEISTDTGATSIVRLNVPQSLSGQASVSL